MAKRGGPTGWDIANLGVDLYQSRQISKMHKDMEDMGSAIQMQVLSMQMAQEQEAAKKALIINARKLVLEIEDQIGELRGGFEAYPANTSVLFDMLLNMIEESPLGPDLFEEFQDIERYRSMRKEVTEFGNWVESEMNDEDRGVKDAMIKYATDEKNLSKAIEIAHKREAAIKDFEESSERWDASQSEWGEKVSEDEERRASIRKTATIAIPSGIVLASLIMVAGSMGVAIPADQAETYFTYVLYLSWAIPLLHFASYSANPVIPSDDPLRLLRDSLPGKESLVSDLDSRFEPVPSRYDGRSTASELEGLSAERLSFVDKHSPKALGGSQ